MDLREFIIVFSIFFRGALMVTMVIKYLGGFGNKSSLWLKIRGDGQRL